MCDCRWHTLKEIENYQKKYVVRIGDRGKAHIIFKVLRGKMQRIY